jgi:hypothetical protein
MELANKEWEAFELHRLFVPYTGGDLIIYRIQKGEIPIISHSISNNGIAEWSAPISGQTLFIATETISLADRGNFYAFTQIIDFYIGTRVKALKAKFANPNNYILQFICTLINKQSDKFSYGNNATGGIGQLKILLPIESKNTPDYAFMENYMKQKETELLKRYKKQVSEFESVVPLSEKEWKEFKATDIFNDIQRGRRLKKDDHKSGVMPYVSSTGINNGVDGFVGNEEDVRIFSNCLTLANSGSVGTTFYQPFSFVASDHVTKLENSNFNKYIYLFIANITSRFSEKYGFNREINDTRIKKEKILLPVNSKNEPDYVFMENYMKELENGKIKQYLEYKTECE